MRILPIRNNFYNFKSQKTETEEEKLKRLRKEADILLESGFNIPFEIDEDEYQKTLAPELDPLDWLPRGWY